jgi:phosphoglycerate dehydrogenase-like enzyme
MPSVSAAAARPRVVVLDDWERSMQRLADWSAVRMRADVHVHHEPLRGAALIGAVADADVLVLMRDRTPLDPPLLDRLPRLAHVIHTGTRNQALDRDDLAARRIGVASTAWGPSKASTCEHTWALILASVRRLPRDLDLVRGGRWRAPAAEPAADVLAGERIGLVGLGEIGSRVARVARAFDMDVVAWSPHVTAERAAEHGARSVALEELLATSRVVSLHLVPSAGTQRLIDAARLATMRRDALLVNTSRAALVDVDALAQALRERRIAAAAFDVFDHEPLPAEHPLRRLPNFIATPHTGFVAEPVLREFAAGVVGRLQEWLDRQPASSNA